MRSPSFRLSTPFFTIRLIGALNKNVEFYRISKMAFFECWVRSVILPKKEDVTCTIKLMWLTSGRIYFQSQRCHRQSSNSWRRLNFAKVSKKNYDVVLTSFDAEIDWCLLGQMFIDWRAMWCQDLWGWPPPPTQPDSTRWLNFWNIIDDTTSNVV